MQTLEPAAFISCLPLIVLCVSFLSLLSTCFSLVSPVCNLFSVSFLLLVFSWCRLSPAPPSTSWRLLSFVGRFSPNFVLSALNFGTSPTENFQSCFISSSFLQVFFLILSFVALFLRPVVLSCQTSPRLLHAVATWTSCCLGRRLETRNWDHKLFWKVFSKVNNHLKNLTWIAKEKMTKDLVETYYLSHMSACHPDLWAKTTV